MKQIESNTQRNSLTNACYNLKHHTDRIFHSAFLLLQTEMMDCSPYIVKWPQAAIEETSRYIRGCTKKHPWTDSTFTSLLSCYASSSNIFLSCSQSVHTCAESDKLLFTENRKKSPGSNPSTSPWNRYASPSSHSVILSTWKVVVVTFAIQRSYSMLQPHLYLTPGVTLLCEAYLPTFSIIHTATLFTQVVVVVPFTHRKHSVLVGSTEVPWQEGSSNSVTPIFLRSSLDSSLIQLCNNTCQNKAAFLMTQEVWKKCCHFTGWAES